MQSPKGGYRVEEDVLQVDGEIEEYDRERNGHPSRNTEGVEKPPLSHLCQHREANRRHRKRQSKQQRVECHDGHVARPARHTANPLLTSWRNSFPRGDGGQNARKGRYPDGQFV